MAQTITEKGTRTMITAPMQSISPEAIAERGLEIYQRDLRSRLETEDNRNKMLVLDIDTGEYEIDPEHMTAFFRLQERRPDGVFWATRLPLFPSTTDRS
jgi:hypothetical protein